MEKARLALTTCANSDSVAILAALLVERRVAEQTAETQ